MSLSNGQAIECSILYKRVPIMIGEQGFPINLIQFGMSKFDIILGMDYLTTHGANVDCRNLKVTLKD